MSHCREMLCRLQAYNLQRKRGKTYHFLTGMGRAVGGSSFRSLFEWCLLRFVDFWKKYWLKSIHLHSTRAAIHRVESVCRRAASRCRRPRKSSLTVFRRRCHLIVDSFVVFSLSLNSIRASHQFGRIWTIINKLCENYEFSNPKENRKKSD